MLSEDGQSDSSRAIIKSWNSLEKSFLLRKIKLSYPLQGTKILILISPRRRNGGLIVYIYPYLANNLAQENSIFPIRKRKNYYSARTIAHFLGNSSTPWGKMENLSGA